MTICDEERHTSQGVTHCTQPVHDPWADHIGYTQSDDGRIWLVSWNGNHTELRQLPDKDQP